MTPPVTLFAAELRAGRPAAINRARRALRRAGSVRGAAPLLGVPVRTLQNWAQPGYRSEIEAFSRLVDELGLRAGPRAEKTD